MRYENIVCNESEATFIDLLRVANHTGYQALEERAENAKSGWPMRVEHDTIALINIASKNLLTDSETKCLRELAAADKIDDILAYIETLIKFSSP